MADKDALLAGAEEELGALTRAIAGLGEAAMREPWCGTWSVRDILAHISGWHRELIPALERLARGEKPLPEGQSYDDVDTWNGRFAHAKRDWSTSDILGELRASHADFMRAARAIPAARYGQGKTAYRLVDLNSRHHYQEHTAEIAAWRAAQGV